MTPSCPSSRRRSLGRWRRLTEIREQEDDTELRKDHLEKKKKEMGREHWGRMRNSAVRKRTKESRKMEGAKCDRREIALHGRSSNVKEVVSFMEYLDICVMPGSNPYTAKKLGQMKPEQRKGT